MKKLIFQIFGRQSWVVYVCLVEIAAILVLLSCLIGHGKDDVAPMDVQTVHTQTVEAAELDRYELTAAELREVASVVTAEAGGEPFNGMMAVAQCILQACEDDGIRPTEAVVKYKYTKNRPEPTERALEAVRAVFERGEVATSEPIKYFYAPALCHSEWHESQVYVLTIQGHKFFKEATTR